MRATISFNACRETCLQMGGTLISFGLVQGRGEFGVQSMQSPLYCLFCPHCGSKIPAHHKSHTGYRPKSKCRTQAVPSREPGVYLCLLLFVFSPFFVVRSEFGVPTPHDNELVWCRFVHATHPQCRKAHPRISAF